ncbi:phosphate ABC transporter permease PstA [Leptolyngbya sp. NIES-2104]|uniref:phosphate ABC transporter permease PstA n=1 Tax=Leptolyngbya sp. NIES-2104 TaxID=1552121 RepID=UPI0006ECA543|nr:phosphate ABC transporter permease PstA [Leptolyngbya sp. NIES-2104]GAP98956.1 phosphate transport system permease protein PstA [Leptolyngbya sp. NIES-2104]
MTSPEFVSAGRDLKRKPSSPRTLFSSVMTIAAFVCAALALIPLAAVTFYVLINGASRLSPSVFTQLPPAPGLPGGGFGNAFVGTLLTVGIAALMAIPFGIVAAIYLSEFGRDTKLAEAVNFLTNVLSGVPSIVIGAFAYSVVVLSTGTFSAVAGGFALAVLMLPTIVRTAAEALEAVPNEFRQAATGLGSTRIQTTLQIVLPAAIPAITTGIMLALARAAGETAPVLFTASFNRFWATSLWEPIATMSRLVFDFATSPFPAQQELAWAGSLVLVLLVLITSVLSRMVIKRR